jgi:hypothetical protein
MFLVAIKQHETVVTSDSFIRIRDCVSSGLNIETNVHRQLDRQTIHIVIISQNPFLHFSNGSRLKIAENQVSFDYFRMATYPNRWLRVISEHAETWQT